MSEDFVTQLRLQLREAAEREGRRGQAARLGREAVARRLWRPALALAALLLLALGLANALSDAGRGRNTPAGQGLRLDLRRPLVGQGGVVYAGFGSVWAADASTGDVVRLDPRTSAVRARVHVGGQEVAFDVGAGAVWALDNTQRLLRIDPATNRVSARIRLPRPAQGVLVAGDTVWVGTSVELQAVNPRSGAAIATIHVARRGYEIDGVATDGHDVYVSRADGTLLVYDANTGAQLPSPGVEVHGVVAAARGTVFLAGNRGVAALDARTARTRWTTDLPTHGLNYVVLAGGALWAEGVDRDTGRDSVWRLDPASGRVAGSLRLPEFGASGMAFAAGRLWLVSTKGVLQVIG
jgi:outer membrane protein assembly factor BamB